MRAEILDRRGDGPTLVYVPGVDGTGRMTLGLEERLADRFDVIRLRYVPGGEDTYPALAGSVVERLAEAGAGPALLLAESFGGGVALTVALDRPGAVRALALVNTFCRYPHRLRIRLGSLAYPFIPGGLFHLVRRLLGPRLLFGRLGGRAERERLLSIGVRFYDRAFHRRLKMIPGLDLRPRLGSIRCPTRIFAGGRDLVLDSPGEARRMATAIPGASCHLIEDGGHLVLPVHSLPWPAWLASLVAAP